MLLTEKDIIKGSPEITAVEEKKRMGITEAVKSILEIRPDLKGYKFFQTKYNRVVFPRMIKNSDFFGKIVIELNQKLKVKKAKVYKIGIDNERRIVFYKDISVLVEKGE